MQGTRPKDRSPRVYLAALQRDDGENMVGKPPMAPSPILENLTSARQADGGQTPSFMIPGLNLERFGIYTLPARSGHIS